ncbi:MAG: hypothetical protein AB4911_10640 [Oscillochloridaceae bacterium umkhey_bin13]
MGDKRVLHQYLRPFLRGLLLGVLALTLAGCLVVSGERAALDLQDGGGNLLTTFVGAEGREVRTLEVGLPETEVLAIVIVGVESGDLEVALYTPEGGLAFAVASRPATQVTRSGTVRTDSEGRLRYAVTAQGARDGSYQIFVQP